jgi:hypothetical protein
MFTARSGGCDPPQQACAFHFHVEVDRVEIQAVRPSRRADLDEHAGEIVIVAQRLDIGPPLSTKSPRSQTPSHPSANRSHSTARLRPGKWNRDELCCRDFAQQPALLHFHMKIDRVEIEAVRPPGDAQ